jgi:hypothetical protein
MGVDQGVHVDDTLPNPYATLKGVVNIVFLAGFECFLTSASAFPPSSPGSILFLFLVPPTPQR